MGSYCSGLGHLRFLLNSSLEQTFLWWPLGGKHVDGKHVQSGMGALASLQLSGVMLRSVWRSSAQFTFTLLVFTSRHAPRRPLRKFTCAASGVRL